MDQYYETFLVDAAVMVSHKSLVNGEQVMAIFMM